jgi:hypothetical protein
MEIPKVVHSLALTLPADSPPSSLWLEVRGLRPLIDWHWASGRVNLAAIFKDLGIYPAKKNKSHLKQESEYDIKIY